MTPWQERTTALTQRMADDMKRRNFAQCQSFLEDDFLRGKMVSSGGRGP